MSPFRKTKTSKDGKSIFTITYNCSENQAVVTKESKFIFDRREVVFRGATVDAQNLFDAA